MGKPKTFNSSLLDWYEPTDRKLPWKGIKDPYKIWVSEIILQQTRAEQAIPYYNNFISKFPSVAVLAKSSQHIVLKYWEGLGYYSRARNLHAAAQDIQSRFNGKVPPTYKELLTLKGVGPYTAAAIASFAFGEAQAVLDGNVYRVIARYFDIDLPINQGASRRVFVEKLNSVFDVNKPALFNQAIMDFGATICKPKNPLCETCPLKRNCGAFNLNKVNSLPVKTKAAKKRNRYFNYFLVQCDDEVLIQQRTKNDIWKGLFQFPLVEFDSEFMDASILDAFKEFSFIDYSAPVNIDKKVSILSHQKINASFWQTSLKTKLNPQLNNISWVNINEIRKFAFPKMFDLFFKQISLF